MFHSYVSLLEGNVNPRLVSPGWWTWGGSPSDNWLLKWYHHFIKHSLVMYYSGLDISYINPHSCIHLSVADLAIFILPPPHFQELTVYLMAVRYPADPIRSVPATFSSGGLPFPLVTWLHWNWRWWYPLKVNVYATNWKIHPLCLSTFNG